MDTSTCGDRLNMTSDLHLVLWPLCSFVQLRTYSPSSDYFLSSQLHWNCMYVCNCNIYTSGYKSGSLCGKGIYQKHRKSETDLFGFACSSQSFSLETSEMMKLCQEFIQWFSTRFQQVKGHKYILKQWIALKVRSDWLLKLQISFAIYLWSTDKCHAPSRAGINSLKSSFCAILSLF